MVSVYITPNEMREIEESAERLGVPRLLLMENAGKSVADFIESRFGARGKRIAVIAGTGDNGGDGFVAARHLVAYGAGVQVFLIGEKKDIRTPRALANLEVLERMRSVRLVRLSDEAFGEELERALSESDVLVDAIFGTGIKGELGEPHASIIERMNSSKAFKLAVDVPSGLDPSTGEICGRAVKADATITFHRAKIGLRARADLVGELVVANIGIPPEAGASGEK